jgi:hypothetical protein
LLRKVCIGQNDEIRLDLKICSFFTLPFHDEFPNVKMSGPFSLNAKKILLMSYSA